jgi:hypothetical protein
VVVVVVVLVRLEADGTVDPENDNCQLADFGHF